LRTKNGILNFVTGYIFYFILAILGIVKVKVFISSLGQELYALNQLYINLFSYLSLAEAGIGVAFTYRLYKLLAKKDYKGINSIFSGTKEMFKKIGIFILIIGFLFSFVVPIFIKESSFSNTYILLTFMLFIIKNSVDYFMSVPRLVIQADQKMYKINLGIYGYRIIEVIIELILLVMGVSYSVILIPSIFVRIIQNYRINKKIFSLYPWLKQVEEKDFSTKSDIKHMLVHRFVGLVSNNIDIVILSSFVGSKAVAIYSSYNYLIKFAYDTTSQMFNSLKDGLGNVLQVETKEKIKGIINEFFSLFSFVASIIVVTFYFVINNFIGMWVGKTYVVNHTTLILFLIIVYYHISIKSLTIIRTAMGLFKETKIMAMVEALINLVLSIILVNIMGINGVLIGTVASFLLTNFWYYPYIIYKKLFNESIFQYITKTSFNIIIIIITILILTPVYNFVNINYTNVKFINWVISSGLIGIITTLFIAITYTISYNEFRIIVSRGKKLIRRK